MYMYTGRPLNWKWKPLPSITQHLSYDDCLGDNRKDYQNCSVLYCHTIIVHNHMHIDMNNSYWWTVGLIGLGFCVFTRTSLFVSRLVIVCYVYFLFVIVWLSVPVQSITWKVSSPKWHVSSGMLNPMHLVITSIVKVYAQRTLCVTLRETTHV